MKWIPLLFLAACATPPPSQYERGAYRPPARAPVRAPTTNPTTDAPRFAPPGHMPMPGAYPRSPHTRLLPPTKNPGLWAGDTKAVTRYGGTIMFLDVNIRIPEVATEEELGYAETCKWALNGVLAANDKALGRELLDMYDEYRGCAVLQMWDYCMRVDWHNNRAKWEISERLRGKVVGPFENQCREKWRKLGEFRLRFESAMRRWMHGTKEETRH